MPVLGESIAVKNYNSGMLEGISIGRNEGQEALIKKILSLKVLALD